MSKSGPIVLGLIGVVVGAGAAALPISDDYSQFRFGLGDEVTLECGNAFADDVRIRDGGLGVTFSDRIFELDDGRVVNAAAACEDSRSSRRIVVFAGLIGGAALFIVGLVWPSPAPEPRRPSRPPPRQQRPAGSQPPPPRPNPPSSRRPDAPLEQVRVSGGSRGSGTPIDPASAQPGTPAAPIPPPQRTVVSSATSAGIGEPWWDQPIEGTLPDASPVPSRGEGPIIDPSFQAAPPAPIPDSVVGSLPPSPVSGRLAPPADPTPAAAPAPIPDALSDEFARSAERGDVRAWVLRTDESDDAASRGHHDANESAHPASGGSRRVTSDEPGAGHPADIVPLSADDGVSGVTVPAASIEQFVLSDGQLLLVDDVSVVGRSPASPISYPDAVLVTVDDRTVSKSHAAFGRTAGELWVEDLHSRNGLVVIRQDGTRQPSPPGETTPLAVGDSVRLGDATTLTVTVGSHSDPSNERRHE